MELRRASSGAYYAALTHPDGLLVARSRTFDPGEAAAAEQARVEIAKTLRVLGWHTAGAEWVRGR